MFVFKLPSSSLIYILRYKLFDLSSVWPSEKILGNYMHRKEIDRRELFLSTKVWPIDLGFKETEKIFFNSLNNLKTSYLDAFLIQWPKCYSSLGMMDCSQASNKTWEESWEFLQKMYAQGSILSNLSFTGLYLSIFFSWRIIVYI